MANFEFEIEIDGITLDHNPTNYSPDTVELGNSARNLDGSLSSINLKKKYVFSLDNITVTDWQNLQRLFARRNKSLEYRDKIYIVQTLDGDGSSTAFNLGRKAYSAGTDAVAWIDGVLKSVTFTTATVPKPTQVYINQATGAVNTGVVALDASDNIEIYYAPIYTVKLVTPKLSYHPNVIYGYNVTFEEI